jgi:hypothetical protein
VQQFPPAVWLCPMSLDVGSSWTPQHRPRLMSLLAKCAARQLPQTPSSNHLIPAHAPMYRLLSSTCSRATYMHLFKGILHLPCSYPVFILWRWFHLSYTFCHPPPWIYILRSTLFSIWCLYILCFLIKESRVTYKQRLSFWTLAICKSSALTSSL